MARNKTVRYKQVTQKDINNIKALYDTGHFSTRGICDVTKRGWNTVDNIIKSGFKLNKYKEVSRQFKANIKAKRAKKKPLTFESVTTVSQHTKNDPYGNDVLNYMHDLQQEQAKRLIKHAERNEAIHKIRNGLQQLSEGLGELL